MHLPHLLPDADLQRSPEGGEGGDARQGRMAHHQVVGAVAAQVQVDVEPHPVGPHVVDGGIHHPAGEGVHLHIAGAEMNPGGAGEGDVERPAGTQVMVEGSLVAVPESHTAHPREHPAAADLAEAVEIHTARGQPAGIEHGQHVLGGLGAAGGHHGHLERAVACAPQQSVGDAQGRQIRLHHHHPTPWRNDDLPLQAPVQPAPQHQHGGGVTGTGVPGSRPERFHPEEVVGQVGRLETVAHRSLDEPDPHRPVAGVHGDGGDGEFGAPVSR